MSFSSLLGLPAGLQVLSFELVNNVLLIQVASTASESACPDCQSYTSRIHSHYTRKAADLACGGHQVQLILHVRKFFCTNRQCPRKIFAERLTAFLQPWARLTTRLGEQIEVIGLASCGRLGARLGSRLKIETSRTSILRRVMKLATKTTDKVVHLGLDDFSFRRGRTFGTVLVDLERHHILDLLPDRQKETEIQREDLAAFRLAHASLNTTYQLVQGFLQMMRQRQRTHSAPKLDARSERRTMQSIQVAK